MITEDKVRNALYSVIDPELGIDVVNLGLIYGIEIDEHSVIVTMTLTTPGCPLHESMSRAVYNAIRMIDPDKEVKINLVWNPPWTPERLTDQAREMLGW
jgi:metal-sulfur cluster biosynthetic enzyme